MSTRRRGRGEGSIYKRRDGRWAARISTGYAHGRRSRMWIYGATRQDVADKLTAALRAQQQGMLVAPERVTVQQFLSRWLDDSARPKLRPRTFDSYVQVVRLH